MSVPPDKMMELIKNQQPGGAPAPNITPEPQANGMSDSSTAPMGTPMSTPEPKMGNKEARRGCHWIRPLLLDGQGRRHQQSSRFH